MFKSVLIIIFVIVILMIARTVMVRFKDPEKDRTISHSDNEAETVQCLTCKTYIPRSDAVLNGNKAFCSTQHLDDWNQRS